jgi:hypothetical protein
MKTLTQTEANAIAKKLGAEMKQGTKHLKAIIRYKGQIIASYGIRRSSQSVGHGHIPPQIFVSFQEAIDLARCPLQRDQYFEILRSKGKLPT